MDGSILASELWANAVKGLLLNKLQVKLEEQNSYLGDKLQR